jgi:hypothetical protein
VTAIDDVGDTGTDSVGTLAFDTAVEVGHVSYSDLLAVYDGSGVPGPWKVLSVSARVCASRVGVDDECGIERYWDT